MRALAAILARDLALAIRHRSDTASAVLFFVLAGALFPLGLGPSPALLRHMAPGIVWVCALLATLLPLDRLFGADHEDGSLDQLMLSGLPPYGVACAKTLAHWLSTGLPVIVASVPLAVMLGVPPSVWGVIAASLGLGTATLSLLGTMAAALVLGARGGSVLLALMVLPLATPLVIFGAAAIESATEGGTPRPELLALAALLALALPLCPIAGGAALRAAVE